MNVRCDEGTEEVSSDDDDVDASGDEGWQEDPTPVSGHAYPEHMASTQDPDPVAMPTLKEPQEAILPDPTRKPFSSPLLHVTTWCSL